MVKVTILLEKNNFYTKVISRKNRLTEREVKKVLTKWKPFFSYWIVLNKVKNRLWYNRFAVVIGSKSVINNVTRNFFRRRFYDFLKDILKSNNGFDYVFVVKKQTKLDKTDEKSINSFDKDMKFLKNKI